MMAAIFQTGSGRELVLSLAIVIPVAEAVVVAADGSVPYS
jgi:hypothetical protein